MRPILVSVVLSTLAAAAGCSKQNGTNGSRSVSSPPAPRQAESGPRTIRINAGDNMKFTVTRIEAAPGEEINISLQNTGSMPKDFMAHNFILLKAGSDPSAYAGAAVMAKASDYLPAALSDQVIAHTKLLGAKQSDEISFKAPGTPGEYPFLCSFPGHFASGMKGVLVVK